MQLVELLSPGSTLLQHLRAAVTDVDDAATWDSSAGIARLGPDTGSRIAKEAS